MPSQSCHQLKEFSIIRGFPSSWRKHSIIHKHENKWWINLSWSETETCQRNQASMALQCTPLFKGEGKYERRRLLRWGVGGEFFEVACHLHTNTHILSLIRRAPDKVAIVRCQTLPQHKNPQLRVNHCEVFQAWSNGKPFCSKFYMCHVFLILKWDCSYCQAQL